MKRPEEPGFFGKVLGVVAGAALLVLGLMFSVVLLAVLVVAGLAAWAWFWWKTRNIRRQLREQPASAYSAPSDDDGTIIEGEAVRENDRTDRSPRLLK